MKSKYLMIGAAVCAALFLFSGIMLCRQYADGKQATGAFEQVAALVETKPLPELTAFEKYRAVQEQNSDFVGWLSVPGTNIDYPVMQTVDKPNFYLKHGFDKAYTDYGCPYVQENCDVQEPSDNLIIYGHHMNDGSMFAGLMKFTDKAFWKQHKRISFNTLTDVQEYEVIAVFKTFVYSNSPDSFKYYHFVDAENEDEFNAYVEKCRELSLYDTGVSAEYGDKLISLSTCEFSRTNGRLVVVAKLVK